MWVFSLFRGNRNIFFFRGFIFRIKILYNELNIGSRIELVSGNVQVDATNYTITVPFTATIPYDAVLNSPISELGLFSSAVCGDKNSMLARVTIPSMTGDNSGITLTPGTNLLVEWSIVIQNKM